MKSVTSYHKTLTIKKQILERKINRVGQQIEDALNANDFFEAERLEFELNNLEQSLLKTYTSYELENLFAEDFSA
jgi:hypothetical protein